MANRDQVKGMAKELGGTAEERLGEVTGDEDLETRGAANRAEGKAQGAYGKVKEAAKDLKDALTDR